MADLEVNTTGWPTLVNCAVAITAAQSLEQTHSMSLTASSAATMSAETTTGTGGVPVTPSTSYTAYAFMRANTTGRTVSIGIQWYTSGGSSISTSTGTGVSDSNAGFTNITVAATSPVNAAFAAVIITVTSPANAEVHYVDMVSLGVTANLTNTVMQGTGNNAGPVYLDQPFTTAGGQTTITRIEIFCQQNGVGSDTTIGIYADSAGSPTGSALAQCSLPSDFQANGSTSVSFPFNLTGLVAATKYHIVIAGTSDTSNIAIVNIGVLTGSALQYNFLGVGHTWTAGTSTVMFKVYSGVNGVIRNIAEDGTTVTTGGIVATNSSPARWIGIDYAMGSASTSGPPTTLREYTGALRSVRTIAYSSGLPTTAT